MPDKRRSSPTFQPGSLWQVFELASLYRCALEAFLWHPATRAPILPGSGRARVTDHALLTRKWSGGIEDLLEFCFHCLRSADLFFAFHIDLVLGAPVHTLPASVLSDFTPQSASLISLTLRLPDQQPVCRRTY